MTIVTGVLGPRFSLPYEGANHVPQQRLRRPTVNRHILSWLRCRTWRNFFCLLLIAINMGTAVPNEAGPPTTTTQDVTPAFLAQSLQPNIYAACIVVTVAATIAVALRLLCRRLAKAYLWWDDWIIIAALVSVNGHKERVTALTKYEDR